jgi:hypothetical protein
MIKNVPYKFLFLSILSLSIKAQGPINSNYNLKDLEILEKEKNYNEFFEHAYELRPSERTKSWKKLYVKMALTMLDEKIRLKEYNLNSFKEIEKISQNPNLIDDEIYQNKRVQFSIKYFKNCFEENLDKNSCVNDLYRHWENSTQDAEAALSYLQLLSTYTNNNRDTWTFYNSIVTDQVAPLYCKKPEIQKAIFQKISIESFNDDFDGNYKKIIGKLISEKCLNALYPNLKDAIISTQVNGLNKEQALDILWQLNQISDEEKDYFLVIYLFGGPVVGQKMNLSWNLVESLSENYLRRMKILNHFKKLELIPDNIFIDPNSPRNKSIINLFAKNFPEVLNYYGIECVNFLKGKEKSHVTSSLTCKQFLEASIKLKSELTSNKWLSDSISTEYSSIKR